MKNIKTKAMKKKHCYEYPRLNVTVDLVLIDNTQDQISVLLIKRKNKPFKNYWAIPGGFIDMKEKVEQAAIRELHEETGVVVKDLKFIGYFDKVDRDPRGRTISFAFMSQINKNKHKPKAADDAIDVSWFDINALPNMAFDHKNILDIAFFKYNANQLGQ